MQTTDHQTGDHDLPVDTELPEWHQQFTEGITRGSSNSTDVSPADVENHRQHFLFPRIFQRNRLRTEQVESTIYSLISRTTRLARYADARKLRERRAMQKTF